MIYTFKGSSPELTGERIFIAPSSNLIGQVQLADDVGIWFNATLRGDIEPIIVGRGTNIQDGTIIHTDAGYPTILGENITIGHNCVIHGCTIGDGTLIGMGSVVLSGAKFGKNCLVGAGALVTGKMDVPDNMLVLGNPARIIKTLDADMIANNHKNSAGYVSRKDEYLKQGIGLHK